MISNAINQSQSFESVLANIMANKQKEISNEKEKVKDNDLKVENRVEKPEMVEKFKLDENVNTLKQALQKKFEEEPPPIPLSAVLSELYKNQKGQVIDELI